MTEAPSPCSADGAALPSSILCGYVPPRGPAVRFRRGGRWVGRRGRRRPALGGPDLSGCAARGRRSAATAGADAGRMPVAAAEPRDRLDVHRRRRQLRPRARRRPDDGAARQDAGRLVGHQLHGLRARPSGRLRLVGRRRRHRLELRRRAALLQEERGPGPERRHRRRRRRAQHRRPARRVGAGPGAPRRAGVRRRRGRGRDPRGRLQRPRPRRAGRRRLAAADHDP